MLLIPLALYFCNTLMVVRLFLAASDVAVNRNEKGLPTLSIFNGLRPQNTPSSFSYSEKLASSKLQNFDVACFCCQLDYGGWLMFHSPSSVDVITLLSSSLSSRWWNFAHKVPLRSNSSRASCASENLIISLGVDWRNELSFRGFVHLRTFFWDQFNFNGFRTTQLSSYF